MGGGLAQVLRVLPVLHGLWLLPSLSHPRGVERAVRVDPDPCTRDRRELGGDGGGGGGPCTRQVGAVALPARLGQHHPQRRAYHLQVIAAPVRSSGQVTLRRLGIQPSTRASPSSNPTRTVQLVAPGRVSKAWYTLATAPQGGAVVTRRRGPTPSPAGWSHVCTSCAGPSRRVARSSQ